MRQLSTTVDALKRDQDDMRQLSSTVDALKRDQDDMRQLSTTVDAMKRDLDKERNRTAALDEMRKTSVTCPDGYTMFREICYKAFITWTTFIEATAGCSADGGTLAMPRDAETDAFLISLYKSASDHEPFLYHTYFWFGLHDRRREGSFAWVDGSALGTYSNWGPAQPNDYWGNQDCVVYSAKYPKDKWVDMGCDELYHSICQAVPGRP
ncbi:lactose-binding lectin l-2-like [Branchiostoma lanceolatum]|uniref:lactose-binding lectin l-2-like n=1 Tax=Branchiostoma lanceolatum TaxID=7740 RepID=UPI0034516563